MSITRLMHRSVLATSLVLLLLTTHLLPLILAQSSSGSSGGSSGGSSASAGGAGAAADAGTPATQIHYEWAHGALMSIAFGFFIPLGIIFARFFRSPKYSPLWLHAHRACVLIGFALIIAGFAIAVNKFDDDKYSKTRSIYHRRAGFYVFAAICLQVFLGFIRPHTPPPASGEKVSTTRVAWNEVHRWNGRVAYVFALAQVYTGIRMLDGGNETLWIVLFSALWGTLILVGFLLQAVVCFKGSAFGDDGTYTRTTLTGNTTERLVAGQQATTAAAGVQMQGVKDKAVDVPAPASTGGVVVQGASITRPVDGPSNGNSPRLGANNGMTVVQIA